METVGLAKNDGRRAKRGLAKIVGTHQKTAVLGVNEAHRQARELHGLMDPPRQVKAGPTTASTDGPSVPWRCH